MYVSMPLALDWNGPARARGGIDRARANAEGDFRCKAIQYFNSTRTLHADDEENDMHTPRVKLSVAE